MKSLIGISQGFDKCTKSTLRNNFFVEHLPMTASAFKHDHDIIIIKGAESLKLF